MRTRKSLFVLAAVTAVSPSFADKLPLAQAPAPVQEAVRSRSGTHRIEDLDRSTRNGQIIYEANWRDNAGAVQQLVVAETGSILRDAVAPNVGLSQHNLTLANRVGVALPETPPVVQEAIHNRIPNAPVDGIQRGIWNGQNVYEVTYHDNGRLSTFQITETGQPVVSQAPALAETPAAQVASSGPATPTWQPRYSGLASANVPLGAGAKMAFHSAPRPVQETVNQLSNGARIDDFERGSWNDHTVYQASFQRNGQPVQLQVMEDGTLVSSSPFGVDTWMSQQATPTLPQRRPLPPNGLPIPAAPQPGLPNSRVGIPNTAAALGEPRFAGLADENVQLEGVSAMSPAGAPRPVQETLHQLANGARVENFQIGNWNGQVVYQGAFRRNGQDIQVQVLDDGSILTKGPGNAIGAPPLGASGTVQQ
jgi:uncharacterized membrane protein YkoI